MDSTQPQPVTPVAGGFNALSFFRWVALITAGLVLIQAFLAGRGWMMNEVDLIDIHGVLGNLTFLTVVGQVILAFLGMTRRQIGRMEFGLSAVLVLLVVAQLGLGYGGRESQDAAAWHVPNGVLIFGIATALVALGFRR